MRHLKKDNMTTTVSKRSSIFTKVYNLQIDEQFKFNICKKEQALTRTETKMGPLRLTDISFH